MRNQQNSLDSDQQSRAKKSGHASDQELIESIATGDQYSMQCIFLRHKAHIHRFILRLIGNTAVATELTNDVFVDVWTQAKSFKAQSSVQTWLIAIARYKALSTLRRRAVEAAAMGQLSIVESPVSPEVTVDERDRTRILRQCILRLSQEHRQIVDLLYYEERSMKEVSRIVEVPLGTVKSRASYARRRLSDLLVAAEVST